MAPEGCIGYRFDQYEVQLRTGTLLYKGHRVRIQKLPLQMLIVLLEDTTQPVSREELRRMLWGEQPFGEFDSGLRVAAAKLREALGDSAASPRFLKTISREGYQFIADVEPLFAPAVAKQIPPEAASPELGVTDRGVGEEKTLALPHRGLTGRARLAAGALATAMATAIAFGVFLYWHRPLAAAHDRILLGEIANRTGESIFDGALSPALRFKIQESPYLSMVDAAVGTGNSSNNLAQDLAACTAAGAQLYIDGEIFSKLPGYQVSLSVWRCRDKRLLTTQSGTAKTQEGVLPALDDAVLRMRRRLGESEGSLQRFNAPLSHATTSSLSALKAFTLGEEKRRDGQALEAISDYKLAIDLDPKFALAYERLGAAYFSLRERTLGGEYVKKAFDLRERTSDRERLNITSFYYDGVTGEDERAIEAFQLWQSMYPRDPLPSVHLVDEYLGLGRPERALEPALNAVQLEPDSELAYAFLARAYLSNGRYKELGRICGDPLRRKSDSVQFHYTCYRLAFLLKDDAAMQRELEWAHGKPQESILLEYVAWCATSSGRFSEALRVFTEARKSAMQHNLVDFAGELDLDQAGFEADLGLPREARNHADEAMRLAPHVPEILGFAALDLARAGDPAGAEAVIDKAAAEFPLHTLLNSALIPSARAAIAIDRDQPKEAIRLMEKVRPYDDNSYMALTPAYYRGMAYLEDKQFTAASREFQAVIDHARWVPESIYITLAKMELGRAAQLAGQPDIAQRCYREVEETWKLADPGFAPLRQLRSFEDPVPRISLSMRRSPVAAAAFGESSVGQVCLTTTSTQVGR